MITARSYPIAKRAKHDLSTVSMVDSIPVGRPMISPGAAAKKWPASKKTPFRGAVAHNITLLGDYCGEMGKAQVSGREEPPLVDKSLLLLGETMRGRRLCILRAAGAATMLACGLVLPVPDASIAAADPGGGHGSGRGSGHDGGPGSDRRTGSSRARAADPRGSTSVGVRVLPGPPTPSPIPHPTLHPRPGHHGHPPLHGSGGSDPGAHSDVSLDVKSEQEGGSVSGGRSQGHGHGGPPISHPRHHHRHGQGHGRPHVTGPPTSHRGNLPITGNGSLMAILGGVVAVLTGAIILWSSSMRRKRLGRRNQG